MKHVSLFAALFVIASASLASAADTVLRVQGNQLLVTSSDGTQLRCTSMTLTPAGKPTATFSIAGNSVQLESGGFIVRAAELRIPEAVKPAAK